MTVLVDSNVLIDVVSDDPVWGEWSASTLERLADGRLLHHLARIHHKDALGKITYR